MSADVAYVDTSAFVKLLVREPESTALRSALREWPRRASSSLLRVELVRVIRRAGLPAVVGRARQQLRALHLIRLGDDVLDRAADLQPPGLRSLDAIHLASALTLADDLGTIVTYDDRLVSAATFLGLSTTSPR